MSCSDHKDYAALMKAWDIMKGVASYVEAKTEEAKNITKVLEIQSKLNGKFEVCMLTAYTILWCNEPHMAYVTEPSAANTQIRVRR